jgi:ABC-type transporter Mla subunit MlaD
MLRGVRVGAVEGIEFPSDPEADYVLVRLWIQNDAAMRVRTDSQAKIASRGLLGDKFVVLTGGNSWQFDGTIRRGVAECRSGRLRATATA